jgi:hypothetical protein
VPRDRRWFVMTLAPGIPSALTDIVGVEHVTFVMTADCFEALCPDYVGTLPDAVVSPGTRDELVQIVRGAAAADVSVRATDGSVLLEGDSGQIVVALRRLDRIHAIDRRNLTLRLQPAVSDVRLLHVLRAAGYQLGAPVRSARRECWRPSDCVVALEVLTASGEIIRTAQRDCIEFFFRAAGSACLLTELTIALLPAADGFQDTA